MKRICHLVLTFMLGLLSVQAGAAQIGPTKFDHLTTGFELLGAHLNVPCESCHVGAIFKGTPRDCSSCHSRGSRISATVKPQNHVLSTDRCDACHTSVTWKPASHFDHQEVQGSCATCHNGVNATGKSFNHIASTMECAACHSVFGWKPVIRVDHTQVNGNCATCHDGKSTTGKPSNHIATTESCDNCHSTFQWKPANVKHVGNISNCVVCHNGTIATGKTLTHLPTSDQCAACHSVVVWKPQLRVDHTQVNGTCFSCHNGTLAKGKIANHPATDNTCENCHSTTAFKPANVSHNGITNNCVSCHNGTTATGKPANHINTSDSCQACHSVLVWKPQVTVDHTQVLGTCASCHNGAIAMGRAANHIPAAADCGVCHLSTVVFGPGTQMNHTGIGGNCSACHEGGKTWLGVTNMVTRPTKAQDPNHPMAGDCSQCHTSTTSFMVDVSGGKPVNHIPTTQACSVCHADSGNYSIFKMNHVGIANNCAQCHGKGLSFANIVPKQPPANHIPTTTVCEACHSPTNFTAFGPNNPMDHTGISNNCQTCHETGMTWFGVTMVDRPTAAQDPNHPKTGDCAQCHTSRTSFALVSAGKPANHIPTTQACTLCHSNAADYSIYTMNHQGIAGGCATCHAAGLSFANIVPKAPPANHFPIVGLACENCHAPTNFGAFGPGTSMSHTGISGNCASCHEKGMSWFGVTMVDRPTAAQDPNHPATGECANCHTSTVSFAQGVTGGNKPANHIPTTQTCTLCHSNPNDYSVFKMSHSGITNNCIQCHGTSLTFANIVPKAPPATHIPTKSIACESCHAASNFASFAGTAMNHTPVASYTCVTCHETGMTWFGVQIVVRPKGHHTGQDCKGCHDTTNFKNANKIKLPATAKTAAAATTSSSAAVNDVKAISPAAARGERLGAGEGLRGSGVGVGAREGRFNLSGAMQRLADVNGTRGATLGGFNHAGMQRACITCHNGLTAIGKSAKHIPSNNSCDNCHTVNAWTPARFEHIGVAMNCVTCHDSVHATGKPANHVQTVIACNTCHSTMAWLPVIFRHSGITDSCQTCHNGMGTSGKPVAHMTTTVDCASCHHHTIAWTPVDYRHTSPRFPGEHRIELTCVQCHTTNTDKIPWTSAASAPVCGACHERNYKPAPHTKYGNVKYTAAELKNCAGSCHIYSDDTLKAVIKLRPGPQHQVSSGQF